MWVDARHAYASAPCPLLLVWGDRDKINPYADSAPLLSRNTHGRVCVITRAGAVPQDEQPDEFAAVVRQFLSESRG
jgi:pimeloyl-ACP methyl ester carboxylesterase